MNRRHNTPDPVDIHVGKRLFSRRLELGLSQQFLAGRTGITFQQIQKYEAGTNRISASRLFKLAGILSVSPGWFFEGLTQETLPSEPADGASPQWLRLWSKISTVPPDIRDAYIEFGQALSRHLGS